MISKINTKCGGIWKVRHIHQIRLIEIPFRSERVFNLAASTQIRVILRLSLPSVLQEKTLDTKGGGLMGKMEIGKMDPFPS